MGNIRMGRQTRPTTTQLAAAGLAHEARGRIAQQIAETSGIQVVSFGGAVGVGEAVKL